MSTLRLLPLLLLLAACGDSGPPPEPLSGVLITLDTTNPRAMDWYGNRVGITPRTGRLADEGLVYDNARSTAPVTLVAHSSMLTGLWPLRHGIRDNGVRPLPPVAETLAERAKERQYDTAAFIAAIVLSEPYGTAQGFDVYSEPGGDGSSSVERTAEFVTRDAIAWLRKRDGSRPFFLWAHYFDAHAPYEPDLAFMQQVGGRGRVPEYLGEVAQMDAAIGELIDVVDEVAGLDHTFLMIVGDHGESLGQHGEIDHGLLAYDATIRIPMLVRYPDGYRAGERSEEIVSIADVFPTFVDALNLGAPGQVDGESLYRREVAPDRGVYFETYSGYLSFGWSPLAGWADREGTYLHGPEPALYLPDDEAQKRNVLAEHPELAARLRTQIARAASQPALKASGNVSAETRDRIRALGYAGGADPETPIPHPLEVDGMPAPEESLDQHMTFMQAAMMSSGPMRPQAIETLQGLVAAHPENALALELLGALLYRENRIDESIAVLRRMESQGRERRSGANYLAKGLEKSDRWEEALVVRLRAHERWPNDLEIRKELARVLRHLGHADEANRLMQ